MKKIFKAKFTEDGVKIPFYKRKWFIILAVLFIFTAIFYEEDKPEEAVNNTPVPPIEQVADKDIVEDDPEEEIKEATLEEAIESAISKSRSEKIDVKILENFGTEEEEDRNIEIFLKGKDNLTTNMVRNGMLIATNDILTDLQPREEIAQVCIFWSLPLVDSYGNVKDGNVMKILLSKDTLDLINFDNFDWNQFPNIADTYYEHAALSN